MFNKHQNPEPHKDPFGQSISLPEGKALPILESAEIIGGQRIAWGSNYTFLVGLSTGEGTYLRAVYKPRDGERPLLDFPNGSLYKREYASYLIGQAIGWPNIPLTVIRDGPYGIGSMQLYVDCEPRITYFELMEDPRFDFQRFAVFDLLANNADRKASHCLLGIDGQTWSIDHGLTFHPSFKVRTVMMEYWGHPIKESILQDLRSFASILHHYGIDELPELLDNAELEALQLRLETILTNRTLPSLDPRINIPWPWV